MSNRFEVTPRVSALMGQMARRLGTSYYSELGRMKRRANEYAKSGDETALVFSYSGDKVVIERQSGGRVVIGTPSCELTCLSQSDTIKTEKDK